MSKDHALVSRGAAGRSLPSHARMDLVDAIYAAATDETLWTKFFEEVQRSFGGYATIYERCDHDPGSHLLRAANLDPDWVRAYNTAYNCKNPWATSPLNQASPVVACERILPPRELERTEFYSDWLRPQGLKHALTCRLQAESGRTLNLGLVRGGSLGEYTGEESELFHSLLPHLHRAVEISHRLRAANMSAVASSLALDQLSLAAVLVDGRGRVLSANAAAESVLRSGGSRALRLDGGSGGSLRAEGALKSAITAATSTIRAAGAAPAEIVAVNGHDGEPRYSVAVLPFAEGEGVLFTTGPTALLLISDLARDLTPSEERLRSRFGLTPAEARLATALCAGQTLNQYSAETGVGLSTVKTHLAALFQKSGESRQTDLVRSILGDPLMMLGPAC